MKGPGLCGFLAVQPRDAPSPYRPFSFPHRAQRAIQVLVPHLCEIGCPELSNPNTIHFCRLTIMDIYLIVVPQLSETLLLA